MFRRSAYTRYIMKRRCARLVAGLLMFGLIVVTAVAEEEEQPPRIGLVLSGGGALGSAHVGVLKVLEELRIPVDFVAGTSMGAIIGGLYSAGVSPAEMEEILSKTDWRDVLEDRPPRRHLPYRQKVDDQIYLTRLEAGFNRGSFQLPPGLISGQKLGYSLQVMAIQAAGINDFDLLPIPFRAVATDLENGEMVVLGEGDLAQAMRASMSLPGIFSPIKINDRLLVDGGLVRNLPVDVARDMGADVIIAVDVGQAHPSKDELASLFKVTGQTMGLQSIKNVKEHASNADVLIEPELEGFGSSQFEKGIEMVPFGEAAARAGVADLEKYSISEEAFRDYLGRLRQRRSFTGAKVRSVQFSAGSTADPSFLMRHLKTRPGDPLDLEAIRKDLERLYETGDYERVDFHITRADEDFDLYIEAIEKSWGPNYLRFGLNLFADFEGESSFDVLASYTMTKLNRLRGEMKARVRLGEHPSIFGEFYQPLTTSQTWFAAVKLGQSNSLEYIPVGGGTYVPYRVELVEAGIDLGLQVSRYAEFRLGLSHVSIASRVRDGVDSGESWDFPAETGADLAGIHFTAIVDQFDNMNFPRNGYFAAVDYVDYQESLGSEIEYRHLVGFLGVAATRGRHTFLGTSNYFSALGSDSPESYNLGGLFRLSGVPINSIVGQYGGNVSLHYLFRLADLPMGLGDGLYVGGSVEGGNLWDTSDEVSFSDLRYGGSLLVGADTMFGPVYLAVGYAGQGDYAFYFYIGRSF